MKALRLLTILTICLISAMTSPAAEHETQFGKGYLKLTPLQENAVRIQYCEGDATLTLPELVYTGNPYRPSFKVIRKDGNETLILPKLSITVDNENCLISVRDSGGKVVFEASEHTLKQSSVQGEPTLEATLTIESPKDEYLFGLGQFQDGYLNVRGLTRRLTQVNTQISIPFLLSSKGYGLLWNNYSLTDFNPAEHKAEMTRGGGKGSEETVNVTSTEGGRIEVRRNNNFHTTIDIPEDGMYAIMLDVGQKMARRHHLEIDGTTIIDVRNLWLPPTVSTIVEMKAGRHIFRSELEREDKPVVYYRKINDKTTFRSPVAECVDYTIFTGSADEVIAAYRRLTGEAPMPPSWALGYIHCRERFHSQDEIIATTERFRQEQIPLDLIVQDWQYWGKHGWNAMKFDEDHYPDPKAMVESLHDRNTKLMLSVWSKIDPATEIGRVAEEKGYFIPGTTWIDFFDPEAAGFYWDNFRKRLLPTGIDAWWQDATEPENDDLEGRRIMKGREPGEKYRNVYPMMVNKTVYEGLRRDDPERRAMIFTRSGFSGIQRYGSALWSGDVGNDWKTLRYQINAGLSFVSTGIPWWTYDAGGFFRPYDQYTNPDYIERMIRWIQTGTFLPLMRVHGYMSNTEPWNYGENAQEIITDFINLRYRLMTYIYSETAKVSFEGSTIMRPFIFDFADDEEALRQEASYMFGQSLLIHPITEGKVTEWTSYLPENEGGWYDWWNGVHYEGGTYVTTRTDIKTIPVFVKGGSIVPIDGKRQYVSEKIDEPLTLKIYPGADAIFTLYEDEGVNNNYTEGKYSTIDISWDDERGVLEIGRRKGSFEGMEKNKTFLVDLNGQKKAINYSGKRVSVRF